MTYIIVLNWNGWQDTLSCLLSLYKLQDAPFSIIVCDNNSQDGSFEKIADGIQKHIQTGEIPYLKNIALKCLSPLDVESSILEKNSIYLIQTGANFGYAGGNNIGIRFATRDPEMKYVWILNNDTEVHPYALVELVKHMETNRRIGLCGSTLLYHDQPNVIQAVGGQYNPWLGTIRHVLGHQRYSEKLCQSVNEDTLDYVIGASILAKRELLESVGLMSEDYFIYFEELDWCTRAKRFSPAYSIGYAPQSIVFHKEGASIGASTQRKKNASEFSDMHALRNRLIFSKKFFPIRFFFVKTAMFASIFSRLLKGNFFGAYRVIRTLSGYQK